MKQPARQLSASKIATPSRMPRQKRPPALDVIPFVMSPLTSCPHLGSDGSLSPGRPRAAGATARQHRPTTLPSWCPPFHHPVFVLTHHAREALVCDGGTTFT